MEFGLAEVLSSLAVGVYIADTTGALVVANDAGLKILGASSLDEIQSGTFRLPDVRGEDGSLIPHTWQPFYRALSGESVVEVLEVIDRVKGGAVILRSRTSPLRRDGAIVGAVKLAIDVTREYDLMKVRDEFIRQAAHELKTPLASIKANAELLSAGEGKDSVRLDALIRGVNRIDGLVDSLLDLADQEAGIFTYSRIPVPLQRLIDGALARLPMSAVRRVRVVAETPIVVLGDEPRLRRALHALVDNAVKYSPPSSTVEISVVRNNGTARVVVRDHGYGIAEDKQARIFEKYFRAHAGTERDPGGLGVGLFVAREILRQHHGTIWFESSEKSGTTFFAELPVAAEGAS
jgi:two-component system, OmpR family, sensor histidine kinase VicK